MRKYIVKSGDTLARIARLFYDDEAKYQDLAQENRIINPDIIHAGQVLRIPGTDIDGATFQLPPAEYYAELQAKRIIVLHFTAGLTASGAYHTFLNSPSRVAAPYLIDRDGRVYELFAPEYWAIHLFRHKPGEYPIYYDLERCTVPVEIVNVGPLKPDADNPEQLNWWVPPDAYTGRETFRTSWCTKNENKKYAALTDRGINYFAKYTDEQYTSLQNLIDHLCARFSIPKQAPADRLATNLEALTNFYGIASHQNFRQDKWDVGPAFEWDKIGL